MQIHRLFETSRLEIGETFTLSEENSRIVTDVLRQKAGDKVEILNGLGIQQFATIVKSSRKSVLVLVDQIKTHEPLRPAVTLLQGLPKGEKTALIIQKSVELGVARIIFFEGAHSTAKKSGTVSERWTKIAIEALRQSGNTYLPELLSQPSLSDAIQISTDTSVRIVFDERTRQVRIRELLEKGEQAESIAVAIGPEGGWSDADRAVLSAARFVSAGLGPYTLRTETAAIVGISAIRALLS